MFDRKTFYLVKRFLATGIEEKTTAESSRSLGFNGLVAFLGQRNVMISANLVLRRLASLSTLVHEACAVQILASNTNFYPARVFLSAYMIHMHVKEVFYYIGTREERVIDSARALLTTFQEICSVLKRSIFFSKIPADLCRAFNANYEEFSDCFKEWESSNNPIDWNRMRSVLVPVYFSFFHPLVFNNAEERAEILENIKSLRARALTIYGSACMDAFDAELRAGAFGIPPIAHPERLECVLELGPRFFVLRNVVQIQRVQELYLDINYKSTKEILMESPIYVYYYQDEDVIFNPVFRELLSFPVSFSSLHNILSGKKRQLLMFVDECHKSWVEGSIDLSRIQADGWSGCVEVIRSFMNVIQRLQSPIRDKETREKWLSLDSDRLDTPAKMVEALKYLRTCLGHVERDIYNIKMLLISRFVSDGGSIYLDAKFKEMQDSGVLTMERTKVCPCCFSFMWCLGFICDSFHVDC
jgi:hypothetical protein